MLADRRRGRRFGSREGDRLAPPAVERRLRRLARTGGCKWALPFHSEVDNRLTLDGLGDSELCFD